MHDLTQVVAVTHVTHDGGEYLPGETIEMTEDQADVLLADGVVETADAHAKKVDRAAAKARVAAKQAQADKEAPRVAKDEPSLDWSRAKLNDKAEALGVDKPADLPNKQAVLDAVMAAGSQADSE